MDQEKSNFSRPSELVIVVHYLQLFTIMDKIFILTRNDLKVIFIGTVVGGIVQYFCWKYVKNHPEMFEQLDEKNLEKKEPIEELKLLKRQFFTGASVNSFISFTITDVQFVCNLNVKKFVVLFKEHGTLIFIGTATGIVTVKKIPTTAVSSIVRFTHNRLSDGSPFTYTSWGKTYRIKIDPLAECNYDSKYMVNILSNKEIPYSDRQKKALIILKQQLNSATTESLIRFLACVIAIIVLFTVLGDNTSVFLMMQNLLEALREGKISKRVARILIRKLLRKGVPVDPELIEAAAD
nr:hypothetical protein [Naviculales sp.]